MNTPAVSEHRPVLAFDDQRGSWGTLLFILTEAMLFVMLFFAYYYLGAAAAQWPSEEPPKLHYALPMLAILLVSSGVIYWGEERAKQHAHAAARAAVVVTLALGGVFIVLSYFDYAEHLRSLPWRVNAYSSIFYTIVSFHLAHLVLGMCVLIYALLLPLEPNGKPPHRPLHNAGLYWHFVDLVWVFVVGLLYVRPYFT